VELIRQTVRIAWTAYQRFNENDGWATASNIALTSLMALFPFLIFLVSIAGLFGSKELADQVANLMLETWPKEVRDPIEGEISRVLTTFRGDVLTYSVALAIFFASSGVETLRIGLTRAYRTVETRHWLLLRIESMLYVIIGAFSLLALGFLVVLGPLLFAAAMSYFDWLEPLQSYFTAARFGTASLVLIIALVIAHKWLPPGQRRLIDIAPGIVATLVLWLIAGNVFGGYLAQRGGAYVIYYAGLATAMMALVFLYLTAMIFIYGGELNAVIAQVRAEAGRDADNTKPAGKGSDA
jgi:membrane protein